MILISADVLWFANRGPYKGFDKLTHLRVIYTTGNGLNTVVFLLQFYIEVTTK